MVQSIVGATSVANRMENAFNTVGKIHIIGMASGVLRTGVFSLKALADVVSFIALGVFNKFRSVEIVKAEALQKGTLTDQFTRKQIQNFKNIALGFIEMMPVFGAIESRNSTTPGARTKPDAIAMAKNMAAADKLADDFFCSSPKPVREPEELKQAGDL